MSATREQVIAEARSWVGTPFHMNQGVKRAGVDCAHFLYLVYFALGMIPHETIERFGRDFMCHRTDQIYILRVLRHAKLIAEGFTQYSLKPLPGNMVLIDTGIGKIFDHGGIVTSWPRVVHAFPDYGVREDDVTRHHAWANRPVKIFDPWEKVADVL